MSSSDDPYAVEAGGLRVGGARFDFASGAWAVELTVSVPRDAFFAVYLPRTQTDGAGGYTDDFLQTFVPSAFPCSLRDLSSPAATYCCLPALASRYRVVASVALPNASACATAWLGGAGALPPVPLEGPLGPDMPNSFVKLLPPRPGQRFGTYNLRLSLDHAELRSRAARWTKAGGGGGKPGSGDRRARHPRRDGGGEGAGNGGGEAGSGGREGAGDGRDVVESFVGFAQFAPTGTRILDAAPQQVRLVPAGPASILTKYRGFGGDSCCRVGRLAGRPGSRWRSPHRGHQ
jgi:hypothetical protein